MSIITRYLSIVTEPQFKLARDLTAMAIADGKITKEEEEALQNLPPNDKYDHGEDIY